MKEWKHYSDVERRKMLLERGYCPLCEIKLTSTFHSLGSGCAYFTVIHTFESLTIDIPPQDTETN